MLWHKARRLVIHPRVREAPAIRPARWNLAYIDRKPPRNRPRDSNRSSDILANPATRTSKKDQGLIQVTGLRRLG
ncbi:hypothetical protein RB5096 [Rhodopirellula baltica SH 1]|uniref:Uncharacterized protein n=1 Tax=Rhodopirellula baltica (strain DSM 10527 / NCIMB 13988 / SH1) TaxID=243090 RepID=Q7UGP5_RHOBA|nr:hypothetical protein RB5096 [Rhodopirellula baltica SH 1]